jgi:hypothetical protein
MAEEDRRISLAGKVLVDKLDAQLLEVQKQGQVVGFGVALTMAGRFHRRNERSTTTYLLYSHDIARLISELLDAATDADPAWRSIVPGSLGHRIGRGEDACHGGEQPEPTRAGR